MREVAGLGGWAIVVAAAVALWAGAGAARAGAAGAGEARATQADGGAKVYPCRWFYVSHNLGSDEDLAYVSRLVNTAADHGLNGMVLTGLDHLEGRDSAYFARLESLKALCGKRGVEIIAILYSAGYGGAVLRHDRNLAAGLPVRDALYVVKADRAELAADGPAELANGGFEQFRAGRAAGWSFHDLPGKVSFQDTRVRHGGAASMRLECAATDQHGHARVSQELAVRPHRCYRLTCWVKTEALTGGKFRLMVLAGGRTLAPFDPGVEATADWRPVTLGFNSLGFEKVRLYAGAWGARGGRLWVDDVSVEEVGLVNVLRRPGAPLKVVGEKTGLVYEEGRDYQPIADAKLDFRFGRPNLPIRLASGTRIAAGERLRVSWYHGVAIHRGQVSVCMSEPAVYDIWRRQAELIGRHVAPKRYLMSMDEIRAGGSCEACKRRKMTMGEILGDCITRQAAILRAVEPRAEVLVWSDMLDPNHNARGDYYLVEGDFTGSWKHVPKDLVIVCWQYAKRAESLGHFSRLGFRTLAGAYYDADTLDNPRGWLAALDRTKGAVGVMYTTWQRKYDLLAGFGDLVARR